MTRVTRTCLAIALLAGTADGRASPESVAEIRALVAAGHTREAVAAAQSTVELLEGADDPGLPRALDLLVETLLASDRAAEPETAELAARAVGLWRAAGGSPSDLASSLTRLGEALTACGELERAAAALTEAEALVPANDARGRARMLNRLGALRRAQGEAVEARRVYAAALAELDRSGAPWDPEVEWSLRGLGGSSYSIGDYHAARRAYQRLYDGQAAALGEDAVPVAVTRRHLAMTESALGNLDSAEALYREALATLEARIGPSHLEIAAAVNGLAIVARKRGDLLEARRQLERALSIMEQLYGPQHRQVAGVLNNLGNLLGDLGDLSAARQAFERALAIRESSPAPLPLEVAQSLSNLGALVRRLGDVERAISLLERALAIREESLGRDSRQVALTLLNLGDALQQGGRLERAREVLERAVAILEGEPDPDLQNLSAALNNLGLVLLRQERLAEAASALGRTREILEETRGHDHPRVATALYNQAKPLAFLGRTDAALGLTLEAARVGREHLRETSAGLSERDALAHASQQRVILDLALSLAAEPTLADPSLLAATWDALLRSRGLVLDELASRRRLLSARGNAPLTAALRDAAERLSRLLVAGTGPNPADEVKAARRELGLAERALAEANPSFAREQHRTLLGLEEVVSQLPRGAALVGYVRFHRRFTQDPAQRHVAQDPWYAAFLRTPDGTVALVPLADAATVEGLASAWRAAVSRAAGTDAATERSGTLLRETIWDPVAARIGDAERVFVVPDGELGLLNFAALPTGPDSFLVEQGPLLAVLGQERDLVPDPLPARAGACLLALGAPDFDAAPGGLPAGPLPVGPSPGSTRTTPEDLAAARFAPLPGTAEETGAVVDLWHRAGPRASALLLTGGEASEAAFKALSPGVRVLHLATHGFFLDGAVAPATGSGRGVGGLVPAEVPAAFPAASDPLRLSGLALAGANRRDPAAAEDGVLTAEEVAVLDLSGVEWAVLSACESGVGEASSLEGVFGLRRAFRVAGARTVIMSLWAVDDEAAREWMSSLYRGRLLDGLSTAEAVRRASLEVLAARRARGESTHPASWAAFVASGDWR